MILRLIKKSNLGQTERSYAHAVMEYIATPEAALLDESGTKRASLRNAHTMRCMAAHLGWIFAIRQNLASAYRHPQTRAIRCQVEAH